MTDEEQRDWGRLGALEERVLQQGEPLALDEETRALLRRGARSVAISSEDSEDALRGVSTATTLLKEIRRRIRGGSIRLSKVHSHMERLWQEADFAGARKVLQDALAAEVVPFYREQLEDQLAHLATLEEIFLSGHVVPDFHPWEQVRSLGLRLQQGHRLELRDDMQDFLRQTAPSAAFSEAETEDALRSVEEAEALLLEMLARLDEGQQRLKEAVGQMIDCEESGDHEGARQALREALSVQTIPRYREALEELLARYGQPPPEE
jgi:DUSAM domain-containing protein